MKTKAPYRWTVAAYGERIGTTYTVERCSYCADDNTYTDYTETRKALACRIAAL